MARPAPDDGIHYLAQTRYGSILFDPQDIPIGRSLEVYGEWKESELEVLAQLVRPGDTVVDIGAKIGTHTLFFAATVGPTGTVYSFEPDAKQYPLLEANLRLNSTDWVRSENALPTLDKFSLQSCRLLHVDLDGNEQEALRGAEKTIAELQPILFVENNDPTSSPQIIELLQRAGYTLFWHLDFAFRTNNAKAHSVDIFEGAFDVNLLAVPKKINAKTINFTPVIGPQDSWQAAVERSRKTSA